MVLNARGVTLLELMVSMALAGLVGILALGFFKDAGHAARLAQRHQAEDLQAESFFNSLSENILAGGGVLKLEESSLTLLNGRNRVVAYSWADSIISINGHPLTIRYGEFKIEPFGPERPLREGLGLDWDSPWELDSLDEDRNGKIDFQELDRDRSDDLRPLECRFIAAYRLTLTYIELGNPRTLEATVHPRNHLAALAAKTWDSASDIGDFPGF